MLYNTSVIAIVGIGEEPWMSPRRLKLLNIKVSYKAVTSSDKKKNEKNLAKFPCYNCKY